MYVLTLDFLDDVNDESKQKLGRVLWNWDYVLQELRWEEVLRPTELPMEPGSQRDKPVESLQKDDRCIEPGEARPKTCFVLT
jgi:hypothetical protein